MTAGFPDFSLKGAPPLDYLGSFAINTSGTVPFDLTSLITPAHNGLVIFWIASLVYIGGSVYVEVDASLNVTAVIPASLILDGGTLIAPFNGVYFTANAGNTCTMEVSMPFGAAGPATGTILVFGVNATPLVVPAIRRSQIGRGTSTGAISVGSGATVTILDTPPAGTYYRIKCLTAIYTAAPAASVRCAWLFGVTGSGVEYAPSTAAGQTFNTPMDFEFDGRTQYLNGVSQSARCSIAYELWAN